jgi:signal transduction histidine kinase
MRRLYVHLYFALLAGTMGSLLAVGIVFRLLDEPHRPSAETVQSATRVVLERLRGVPEHALGRRLRSLGDELGLDLLIWNERGELVASSGPRPLTPPGRVKRAWEHGGRGVDIIQPISPDRLLGVRVRHRPPRVPMPLLSGLILLALVMAIGAYPVARRLTKRIETLAAGVARWGAGDLGYRVPVEGRDEVATLAATFNHAAERVDALVAQQRELLASASHELRSPLARLRMALELVEEQESRERRGALVEGARRDIVDLDALIEELLLMARTDGRTPRRPFELVDLSALLAQESVRVGVPAHPPAVSILGDPLLLRHLLRNLLENAERHAGGEEVSASVEVNERFATLIVEDRGPGVPEKERDRIFAPFYRIPGADKPGTGIGLALVRQVAHYHGGQARVLPREGGGSRFEVSLPVKGPNDTRPSYYRSG